MKKIFNINSVLLVALSLIILFAACAGPKSDQAQLPYGLSSALVPALPLDGYGYMRQSEPTIISGGLPGLFFKAAIQSVQIWIAPSGSTESIGTLLTFSAPQDAAALSALIPSRADLWKLQVDSNIYLVWGTGNGADELKKAINARHFILLKDADKEAWNLIQRLPGPPANNPIAVGFIRMEDRLIEFTKKHSPVGSNENVISAIKLAKVKIAAAAFYSTRDLQIMDFMSPARLKEAGAGGILIARSSYPGFVISTGLGQAASRLNIEKTEIDGRETYYASIASPTGEKVHSFINSAGQYIYAQGSTGLERSQQLYRWVWQAQ